MSSDKVFYKCDSRNLPEINAEMLLDFLKCNPNFEPTEVQNATAKATRKGYCQNAVEYVEVSKDDGLCIVRARVTPETTIRKRPYMVKAVINTNEGRMIQCVCNDCKLPKGGCKHVLAFLLWLHTKHVESAPEITESYWTKSQSSSTIGNDLRMTAIFGKPPVEHTPIAEDDNTILDKLITLFAFLPREKCLVKDMATPLDGPVSVGMHECAFHFSQKVKGDAEVFLAFMCQNMTKETCVRIEQETRANRQGAQWYEYQYGRITAAIINEAANYDITDGSLVTKILGTCKQTESNTRKQADNEVLQIVANSKQTLIRKSGIVLNDKFPAFVAAPDGINDTHCVMIVYPASSDAYVKYVQKRKIMPKYYFQLQLHMMLTDRPYGYFCMVSPKFASDKEVKVIEVSIDNGRLMKPIMEKSFAFWKSEVFPKIINVYKH